MTRHWLLAVLLALPAASSRAVEVVQGPPTAVHPLLLGPLEDAASPVARELTAAAGQLAALAAKRSLTPSDYSLFLNPLLNGTAAQRPAAAILAKVVAERDAAAALFKVAPSLRRTAVVELAGIAELAPGAGSSPRERSALKVLSSLAGQDAYAKLVFDGYAPSNALQGLTMTAAGPASQKPGVELERLGAGSFGVVHEHPHVMGAVIKTIFYPKGWGVEARRKMYEFAHDDERAARALAAAGAGPRLLSHTDELGSPVLIKERVYGASVRELIKDGLYTEGTHKLVLALIDKIARARLVPGDLREPNIIIGRTLLDPERKAYLIDGGELTPANGARTHGELVSTIYTGPARWVSTGFDGNGEIVLSRPLNQILEEALVASGQAPWWTRLKVAWRRWRGTDRPSFEPR